MNTTQAAIDEYNKALKTIIKTKKMLDDIKQSMEGPESKHEPEPEPECNYDMIIEMLIANGNIKYRD